MARQLALVVSIALCALVLPGAAPPTVYSPGAPGVGDPYFPLDGNGGYDVKHYDLAIRYAPASDALAGVVRVRALPTQRLSAFNLDLDGLTVDAVTVNGRALNAQGGPSASVILAEGDRIEMGEVAFIFHSR